MLDSLGQIVDVVEPMLIVNYGDSKDVFPRQSIGDIVVHSRNEVRLEIEFFKELYPSCLFGCDGALHLDVGDASIVGEVFELQFGLEVTFPIMESSDDCE